MMNVWLEFCWHIILVAKIFTIYTTERCASLWNANQYINNACVYYISNWNTPYQFNNTKLKILIFYNNRLLWVASDKTLVLDKCSRCFVILTEGCQIWSCFKSSWLLYILYWVKIKILPAGVVYHDHGPWTTHLPQVLKKHTGIACTIAKNK